MHQMATGRSGQRAGFAGLRATAEQYFALPDDGIRYELIDGVVVMSPSPSVRHQVVAGEIYRQLANHVRANALGLVLHETDVALGAGPDGRDLVYRPEIVFICAARTQDVGERLRIVPDLVVEVISRESRTLDTETKFADYQRVGVGEYWLIDPIERRMTFFELRDGRFAAGAQTEQEYRSVVVSGFELRLDLLRDAFGPRDGSGGPG